MPLTIMNKNTKNIRILTGEGKILEIGERGVCPASRRMFSINNNKSSVCFENVGIGADTNAICFGWQEAEYGNLTADKVKACMKEILKKGYLDLSDVRVIHSLSEINMDEEYFLFYDGTELLEHNNIFRINLENSDSRFFETEAELQYDVGGWEGYCEDED